jgi:hypothetical protein
MRRRDALALHNGDEVRLKQTQEVCTVYRAYRRENDPRVVMVEIQSPTQGFLVVDNTALT